MTPDPTQAVAAESAVNHDVTEAAVDTQGGGGRVPGDTVNNDNSSVTPDARRIKPPVINEMLCYIQFHIKRTPMDNIGEVLKRFYSEEEVTIARDVLIEHYSEIYDYDMKDRHNTTASRGAKGKKKSESFIEDILNVMYELDRKSVITVFVVRNLARLPRCDPKDVDPYGNLQLILDLQERVRNLEDNMGSVQAQVIGNIQNIKLNDEVLAQHEIVYAEHDTHLQEIEKSLSNSRAGGAAPPAANFCSPSKSNNHSGVDKSSNGNAMYSSVVSSGTANGSSQPSVNKVTAAAGTDSTQSNISNKSNNNRDSTPSNSGVSNNSSVAITPCNSSVNANATISTNALPSTTNSVGSNTTMNTITQSSATGVPAVNISNVNNASVSESSLNNVNQHVGNSMVAQVHSGNQGAGWSGQSLGLRKQSYGGPSQKYQQSRQHRGSVSSNGQSHRYDSGKNNWNKVDRYGKPIYNKSQHSTSGWSGSNPPFRSGRILGSGVATNTSFRGAPPPKRDLLLSRVASDVIEQDIIDHLNSIGVRDFELKLISNENSIFKSYKLIVNVQDKDTLMSPDVWPPNVCIKRYRERVYSRDQYFNHS